MVCRGIRGATTVDEDTADAILAATRELLVRMVEANGVQPDDVASIYFTTTPDLTSAFPAAAVRELGWYHVATMCGHEIGVPGGLPRCIRVLLHWNTDKSAREIVHVYLRGAAALRPDRACVQDTPLIARLKEGHCHLDPSEHDLDRTTRDSWELHSRPSGK